METAVRCLNRRNVSPNEIRRQLSGLQGMDGVRFTIEGPGQMMEPVSSSLPAALATTQADAVVLDTSQHLSLPFRQDVELSMGIWLRPIPSAEWLLGFAEVATGQLVDQMLCLPYGYGDYRHRPDWHRIHGKSSRDRVQFCFSNFW